MDEQVCVYTQSSSTNLKQLTTQKEAWNGGSPINIMAKNGNLEQHFQMLQSNSGVYGVPETG